MTTQHDMVIANDTRTAVRADINNALKAIASQHEGAADPGTLYPYQRRARIDLGVLLRRNAANSGDLLDGTLAETLVIPKSGAFTAGLSDYQRTFICTGTWSMAFAAAATLRDGWWCGIKNNGAGVITLNPDGAETIDDAATLDIAAGQSCVVCCDGSELYVIGVLGVSQTTADERVQLQSAIAFTTAGTSTAYTLTTSNAPALTTNECWRVKFNAAAGSTPTLNRDAKGAKSLKYKDSSGNKQAITSKEVPSGWISDVEYDGTDYVVLQIATVALRIESSAVTTTSGTSNALTGIPSWAKRITILLDQVSLSGGSAIALQVGTSGGLVTSGYNSSATSGTSGAAWTTATSAADFLANAGGVAGNIYYGRLVLEKIGTKWHFTSVITGYTSAGAAGIGNGVVDLGAGVLDRIALRSFNGVDTFDAGSYTAIIEG